jgi:hypothetical protein
VAILSNDASDRKAITPNTASATASATACNTNGKTDIADLVTFHSAGSNHRNVFVKISFEADKHPYFSRVWIVKHRLDENSPLLTSEARSRVKMAGGHWPSDMNNYLDIKNCLQFRHLLVFVSGTSNSTASTVYVQKVYDLADVALGYRFVPMNYYSDDGVLNTDTYLLNAVCQQHGGLAEPFQ